MNLVQDNSMKKWKIFMRPTLYEMQCGRLQLQERRKNVNKIYRSVTPDKPRRYCQKRLVNPQHEEDPRWIDVLDRFHCNDSGNISFNTQDDKHNQLEDLFLSVQNLKFQGDEHNRKRPRTSFKYKTLTDGNAHRMFVKQVVDNVEQTDDDSSSQLTCYYYDDYVKYLSSAERSRPSSTKSSIFLQGISTRLKENKAVQVDILKPGEGKKFKSEIKTRKSQEAESRPELIKVINSKTATEDTKITFHRSGKRKSLTISRAQSPETVQVIRVDVVCNYSGAGATSAHQDNQKHTQIETVATSDKNIETINTKNSHFSSKYLLTNTVKTLDENVSGGANVTLLCKTFRLTDRSKSST